MRAWAVGTRTHTLKHYSMLPLEAGECVDQTLQAGNLIHMHNLSQMGRLIEIPSFAQGCSSGKEQCRFQPLVSIPEAHVPLTMGTTSEKVHAIQCQQGSGGKDASGSESRLQGRQ